ncbi:hypothetical protein [Priestia flexa]|uniref:hypothetical protein n=1 Tax=Priestia flexa TaxID=86664 RepID=UPI00099C6B8D|nr:hypothetical protein [Priestia flexa]AQX53083.1 hypothetical protein BC359_01430 [Priestia flexa]
MEERVLNQVRESIQNNDYIIGSETRFNIITVKMSDSKYYVLLVEDKKELQSSIEDSLKKLKLKVSKCGLPTLLQQIFPIYQYTILNMIDQIIDLGKRIV